jgi:hypothetical protein
VLVVLARKYDFHVVFLQMELAEGLQHLRFYLPDIFGWGFQQALSGDFTNRKLWPFVGEAK